MAYYENTYHCCVCKTNFDRNTYHCCDCVFNNKTCNGECEKEAFELLMSKLKDFWMLNKNIDDMTITDEITNDNFIPSFCLGNSNKCNAYKKFMKTVKILGFTGLKQILNDDTQYKFAYHGTNIISNAQYICCDGFNINLRNRQIHGVGEYFSSSISTCKKYSKQNGCIIVALILTKHNNFSIIDKSSEKWYVVNNTKNDTYVLPIGIYETNIEITDFSDCPKKKFKKIQNSNKINVYYIKNGDIYDYDDYAEEGSKLILENIKKNNYKFIFTYEDDNYKVFEYLIDLSAMTQTNMKSNTTRGLLITC
jgi:hypothetical protein